MWTAQERVELHLAGCDVRIRAPKPVFDVLERMLAHVSRDSSGERPALLVRADYERDLWRVSGTAPRSHKILSGTSALPQVAGAIVSSLVAEVAFARNLSVWRGSVVERDGWALALVGDDWESCITLTAHLHTRGWRILGGDYVLVERDGLIATPFRKALHANSSCVAAFPLRYRPAIERSPWYSASNVIAFYALDPASVGDGRPWGERSPLRAVLTVDGHTAEHPALEGGHDFRLTDDVGRAELTRAGVAVAALVRSDFIETCDFLERWFRAVVVRAISSEILTVARARGEDVR